MRKIYEIVNSDKDLIRNDKELLPNDIILEEVLKSGLLNDCVNYQFIKLCKTDPEKKEFKEDMLQDLYLILYNYDNEKLNNAYRNKHMNALITRILINQLWSKSSAFYNRYIKSTQRGRPLEWINELEDLEDEE